MTLSRPLPRFVLLGLLVVASSGVLAYLSPAPPALATTPTGQQLTAVPVRWCVMKGTAPDINPSSLGEADPDPALWRRHARPSDRVWIPQAGVTLRSSVTWQVLTNDNFPVIDDPDTSVGNGPGDVVSPNEDNATEFLKVKHACEDAWRKKNWIAGVPVVGVTAVSIGRFVHGNGTVDTNVQGYGRTGFWSGDYCTAPGQISIS